MLTRLLYGGRMSLVAGVTPVLIALLVGSTLGITAGYRGRAPQSADHARGGYLLCVSLHPARHRHLRSLGGRVEEHDYRAFHRLYPTDRPRRRKRHHPGARLGIHGGRQGEWRRELAIIRHHMIANVLAPIFVYASTLISVSVIIASGLSFLGLGRVSPERRMGADAEHATAGRFT